MKIPLLKYSPWEKDSFQVFIQEGRRLWRIVRGIKRKPPPGRIHRIHPTRVYDRSNFRKKRDRMGTRTSLFTRASSIQRTGDGETTVDEGNTLSLGGRGLCQNFPHWGLLMNGNDEIEIRDRETCRTEASLTLLPDELRAYSSDL